MGRLFDFIDNFLAVLSAAIGLLLLFFLIVATANNLGMPLGDFSQAITAAFAVLAVMLAAGQIAAMWGSQRQATAKNALERYLEVSFENPTFAYPTLLGDFDHKLKTIAGSRETYERYEWFVSLMLFAAREIYTSRSADLVALMNRQIGYHKDYFRAEPKDYWWDYGREVRSRIRSIRADIDRK